jgi:hypothetical protein
MKIRFTFLFLLFHVLTFGQVDSNKLNEIRKTVEQINKDTAYSTKVLNNEEFMEQMTDRGGYLTGYYKRGKLVKIIEWIGLSRCNNITEYYLQNNRLVFAYTEGQDFTFGDSSSAIASNILSNALECRFYFDNDKLVKSIMKGSTACSGEPSIEWAKQDLDDCKKYIKLLAGKEVGH